MQKPTNAKKIFPVGEWVLFYLLIGIAVGQFGFYFLYVPFHMHGVDFTVLWRAARQLLRGEPVYMPPPVLVGQDHWEVFKYPQFLAGLTAWLGALPLERAEFIWKTLMVGCIIATGWISAAVVWRTCRQAPGARTYVSPRVALAGIIASLSLFSPLAWSLELGQVGPFLMLMLTLAFRSQLRCEYLRAGVWIGLASLLKVQPVLLYVPHVLWRKWRALVAAVILAAAYVLTLAAVGRLRDEIQYFSAILPDVPRLAHVVSFSVFGALSELLHLDPTASPERYQMLLATHEAIALGGYLGVLWILKRSGSGFTQCWIVALVALPLVSPVLEGHHFVILWPAWLWHVLLGLRGRLPRHLLIILILCWLPILQAGSFHRLTTTHALRYIPVLGNAALFTASVILALRSTRDTETEFSQ